METKVNNNEAPQQSRRRRQYGQDEKINGTKKMSELETNKRQSKVIKYDNNRKYDNRKRKAKEGRRHSRGREKIYLA